ncbi:hypothetical protein D3C80_1368410 [compost metagenome]
MQALRIVGAVLHRRPGATAVQGAQDQVEHADRVAALRVDEPDVEERLVGAFVDQSLALGDELRPLLVVRLGAGQRLVVGEHQLADLPAVQLLLPAGAAIAAVQHHAIVADRPALLGGGEMHRVEVGADRHAGLLPALAGILGIQNVTAQADRDQPITRARHIAQRAARCQFARAGRQVQHIHEGGCLGHALQRTQRDTQRQQRALIEGTHYRVLLRKPYRVARTVPPGK